MKILDGKKLSEEIKIQIKNELQKYKLSRKPKLTVIIVGEDYASWVYVKNKVKSCNEVGILTETISFDNSVSEQMIINTINELNNDENVDGILVQLPLTKKLNELKILNSIKASKDVDGLTDINLGKLLQNDKDAIIPCTVKGIIKLLNYYQIEIDNKNITIINNSNIVGKPLAMILNNLGATVSVLHKKTSNLSYYLKNSDIICSATGVYNLFTNEQVKNNVTIIDIGINKTKGQKLVGDVNFEEMKLKASAITPVPGGVGPMTIAMLLENLFLIYKKNINK